MSRVRAVAGFQVGFRGLEVFRAMPSGGGEIRWVGAHREHMDLRVDGSEEHRKLAPDRATVESKGETARVLALDLVGSCELLGRLLF